jgi:NhaP-type Na+/H+ or K+/H+ antiporter
MLALAGILLLGIGTQWLAWRLRMPAILLLLFVGFCVGPFSGQLIDPDALLGEALQPFVALSVAVILFEGGMTLRFRELAGAGRAVTLLVVLGPVFTFALAGGAAYYVLGFAWQPAALLGALLIVTGPTVIGPLLRHVQPSGNVAKVVRWEGIVTDPIGAIAAVLVFQAFLQSGDHDPVTGLWKAVLAGGGLGLLMGEIVVVLLKKKLIPDFLHAPVTLALALLAFVAADEIQHESGLLAVTLMGVVLANQRRVVVEHILEFKENMRVILVSTLFILLAARLPLEEFTRIDLRSVGFVVVLIVVVRPLAILFSTLGSGLTWPEKAFVAWMAPRGIVAAAVASVFALQLDPERFPEAEHLVPVVFLVIITTVAVYGLTAAPLARRLGLSKGTPQGVVFIGAHSWSRAMAMALSEEGVEVLLVDTNYREVQAARILGLRAHYGNALSDEFEVEVPLDGLGHLVCLTHNDQVNALACLHFAATFGRGQVHQLRPEDGGPGEELPAHLRGHVLFGDEVTYWQLESRFRRGDVIKRTRLGEGFSLAEFEEMHGLPDEPVIPLFVLGQDGKLSVVAAGERLQPKVGDTLVALIASQGADSQPATSSTR